MTQERRLAHTTLRIIQATTSRPARARPQRGAHLHRPSLQHRRAQKRTRIRTIARRWRPPGFGGKRYRTESSPPAHLRRHLRRLHRLPPPAHYRSPPRPRPHRFPLPSHRPARGSLLQGHARQVFAYHRAPAAPASRTRSSGPTTTALAPPNAGPPSTTTSSGTPTQGLHLPLRGLGPHPLHGAGPRQRRESGARQNSHHVWSHTIVPPTGK